MSTRPPSVLLVGSVPLASVEDVFAAAARAIGARLERWPDGETGARANWIGFQQRIFSAVAGLERTATKEREYQLHAPFGIRAGVAPESLRFGPLGYADAALASYQHFRAQKKAGAVPADARFLVALPTPWAPVYSFIAYRWHAAVYPIYARALLDELAQIAAAIPPAELSIQWDVATEMSWWESVYPAPFDDHETRIVAELALLGAAVPPAVELGFHLCYGSMGNRHWKEPVDLGNCVRLANRVAAALPRTIDFLHMPVPADRRDAAYFAPLADLALPTDCELYLGLLHLADGVDGALARIATARAYAPNFGLACECGLGRHRPEVIPAWLELHADVAQAAAPLFA